MFILVDGISSILKIDGEKNWQAASNKVPNSSIYLHVCNSGSQGEEAGAYPSCRLTRGRVDPRQLISLLLG